MWEVEFLFTELQKFLRWQEVLSALQEEKRGKIDFIDWRK